MQLKKLIYQICLSVALVSGGWAQIGTNPTGGPDIYGHNWITSAASGTTIGFDWLDARSGTRANFSSDDTSSAISLGFTFNFYGTDYTQIYISTGGFISFDPFTRSPGFYDAAAGCAWPCPTDRSPRPRPGPRRASRAAPSGHPPLHRSRRSSRPHREYSESACDTPRSGCSHDP